MMALLTLIFNVIIAIPKIIDFISALKKSIEESNKKKAEERFDKAKKRLKESVDKSKDEKEKAADEYLDSI